ncbi:MAG: hypothetical protein AMXMBFR84_24390 [Candidatus Hydrogenedentota bacterium]
MKSLRPHYRGPRSGITLLELLVYLALSAMIINLAMTAFANVSRLHVYSQLSVHRQETVRAFQIAFASTVRESLGVVAKVGDHVTGDGLLILRMTPDDTGADRFALVGQVGRDRCLYIAEAYVRDGTLQYGISQRFDIEPEKVTFAFTGLDPVSSRSVSVSLEIAQGKSMQFCTTTAAIRAETGE